MGAWARGRSGTSRRAPARHEIEQGRVREDSAGPAHAGEPSAGQRSAPARVAEAQRRAPTFVAATGTGRQLRFTEHAASICWAARS
ncbi:hypothetical protein NDU88_006841 [Pleurodeles waltl]|uniref:Uncharacterized protein n=1 Tax=Pleurodeles waltl TaxID=8319 RepID=A0AAV7TYC0_PLEWA|nr:hypothetical protein NDU88_006841 [Pleurodeles waltl]